LKTQQTVEADEAAQLSAVMDECLEAMRKANEQRVKD